MLCKQLAAKSALRLIESSLLATCNKDILLYLASSRFNPILQIFVIQEEWDEVAKDTEVSIYMDGSELDKRLGGGVFSVKLNTRIAFCIYYYN